MLGGIYAAVIVFGWPVLVMSLLGLADTAFDFRGRAARRRGPPNPRNLKTRRTTMEVILLERVAKLGQMGEVVRVKDGFARNFLLPQGQGAARDRGQQVQVRRHEGRPRRPRTSRPRARPTRSAQSSTARASRDPPGLRNRPALRLGVAARSRRAAHRERLRGRPQPDRAQHADQDHRPAQGAGASASGGRGDASPSTSRAAPTRPSGWRAARMSPSAAKAARKRTRPRRRRPRPKRSSSRAPAKPRPTSEADEAPPRTEASRKRRRP